jgi:hypothetical protein
MPDADWGDAFAITVDQPDLTPTDAASHVMNSTPAWYNWLLGLRNIIVKPLGLKTKLDTVGNTQIKTVGVFPLVSDDEQSVVLGLDDHHLNFRIVFETEKLDQARTLVRSITLVRRNNRLGKAYLAAVMPFHNRIVPAMLNAAYAS